MKPRDWGPDMDLVASVGGDFRRMTWGQFHLALARARQAKQA